MAKTSPNFTVEGLYAAAGHWASGGRDLSRHSALSALRGTALVYAMRLPDGCIKIGHTRNIAGRVRQLSGEILGLRVGSLEDEQEIHALLADSASHGREYYHPTPAVLAVVNEMRDEWNLPHIAA